MKFVQVNCDHCQNDLAYGGPTPAYRLLLHAEEIPIQTTMTNLVMVYPPVEHDMHFCGLRCLHRWLAKKMES